MPCRSATRRLAPLLLAWLAVNGAAGEPPWEASALRKEAAAFYGEGRYAEAAAAFRKASEAVPGDSALMKDWLWALWYSGQYDEAIRVAMRLTIVAPDDAEAWNMMAQAQQRTGGQNAALRTHLQSIELPPGHIASHRAVGRIHENLKDYGAALRHYRTYLRDRPGDPEIHADMGRLFSLQGLHARSAEFWRTALGLSPEDSHYRLNLAKSLYFADQREPALALLQELAKAFPETRVKGLEVSPDIASYRTELRQAALVLEAGLNPADPDSLTQLLQLVDVYFLLRMDSKLMETFRRILAAPEASSQAGVFFEKFQHLLQHRKSETGVLNLLALAQIYAGRRDDASDTYRKSLALNPDQPLARRAMARLHEARKDYDGALQYFREYQKSRPDDAGVYADIARTQFHLGLYEPSVASWRKALELNPADPDYRLQKAKALYFAGQTELAQLILVGIVNSEPKKWAALDFLVEVSSMTGNLPTACAALENALKDYAPEDEPRLLRLAELYYFQGMGERFLGTLDRVLRHNPKNGEALLEKAGYFMTYGRHQEAAVLLEQITRYNPSSLNAWVGLAEALFSSSQTVRSLQAAERAMALDPTDPYLVLFYARHLYESGERDRSKRFITEWLENNEEVYLPVLLYHGLTPYPGDPMLANSIHMTTAVFQDHMRALYKSDYTPVSIADAVAWFQGRAGLPKKSVLVTFDDARIDSLRYADPIFEKYGFKATMFAPMSNVERDLPGFASWGDLARYQATGRWEIGAHGDAGHIYVQVDGVGRTRLFLPNLRWLPGEMRLETVAEWRERVRLDHVGEREKILKRLGKFPIAYAFPEGDYGQLGIPNFPDSGRLSLKLCREAYALCFHQGPHGLNVRSQDPALAGRVEPRGDWPGKRLIRLITDENPFVLMRRDLLARAVWEGRIRDALGHLEENRRAGVSYPTLLADEADLRFASGDRARGLELARLALRLDATPGNRKRVEEMRARIGLEWNPSFHFYSDNKGRERWVQEQYLGSWAVSGMLLRAYQSHSTLRETGVRGMQEHGGGLGVNRIVGLSHSISLDARGHALSGAGNDASLAGTLRSKWGGVLETDLNAGRRLADTAVALRAGVSERYAGLEARLDVGGSWKAAGRLGAADISDDNRRYGGSMSVSRTLFGRAGPRVEYRLTADTMDRVSPRYYSPRRLLMNQLGLGYGAELFNVATFSARYMPGYGNERGAREHFIQVLDLDLILDLGSGLSLRPSVSLSRTPTYKGDTYSLPMVYRF